MSRRKGTPCACNSDPCGCGGSRSDCIKTVNNEYPDPNRNLEIKAGAGIQIVPADHGIEIINISDPDAFVAGDNIEIIDNADGTRSIRLADDIIRTGDTDLTGDVDITGDLTVNGNIIQNGAYYDTHAEHIYSRDDYIIMRDGAVAALAAGDYSGFQVKLYDGVNDGRLVIDNSGTARVGDVGDEQPLLTREESANLTDGYLLAWDSVNMKAINGIDPSSKQDTAVYLTDTAASSVAVPNTTQTVIATVTATKTGTAIVTGNGRYGYSSGGSLYMDIVKNSDSMHMNNRIQLENAWNYWTFTAILPVTLGDTISIVLFQNSGSSNSSNGTIQALIL